jgi:hypothetical protein
LDIYTGPVGSAVLSQQIHDYSPPIAANGLFWTIPIDPDGLRINLEEGSASLRVEDLAITDSHDLANNLTNGHGLSNPPIPPIAPVRATVSFDVEWSGVISRANVVNEMQNFSGNFIQTGSTIQWSSEQDGFFFDSEDPNPARNIGAVIGRESNGVFFGQEGDDESAG